MKDSHDVTHWQRRSARRPFALGCSLDASRAQRPARLASLFVGVAISASVGACGPRGRIRNPDTVVAAYAEALRERDPVRAISLLEASDRAATNEAAYRSAFVRDEREVNELAGQLARAHHARVTATVELDDGSAVDLVLQGGRFVVRDPLRRYYGQATPREALRSFVRAVAHDRWDVLLALMPNADRAQLDAATLGALLSARREELTRTSQRLEIALDAPIEVVGDRATMPYGESYTARLVLEDERWKLEDPD